LKLKESNLIFTLAFKEKPLVDNKDLIKDLIKEVIL